MPYGFGSLGLGTLSTGTVQFLPQMNNSCSIKTNWSQLVRKLEFTMVVAILVCGLEWI